MRAFERADISAFKRFIKQGWHPAARIDGKNPLIYCDDFKLAKFLIEAGAKVNEGRSNWTPLIAACDMGCEDIVAYLVAAGANVNKACLRKKDFDDDSGVTPLMMAAGRGHLGIVQRLLKAGANLHAVDNGGHNALWHALICGHASHASVAKELLKRRSKAPKDALAGPVYHGNLELVRKLVKYDVDLDFVYPNKRPWPGGHTLLGHAIEGVGHFENSLEIAKELIKAGADVNKPSHWWVPRVIDGGETIDVAPIPLTRIAAALGREDVLKMLWKAGAKGGIKEAVKGLSLEKSVYRGSLTVVKLLLQAGVDVNTRGHEGKTPLEWARIQGHAEIEKLLKEAGAVG